MRVFFILIALIYFFLVIAGWLNSNLLAWDQVMYLRGTALSQLNFYTEAHALRYLLIMPIFLFSKYFAIDANKIFSIVIAVLTVSTSINIASICEYYTGIKREVSFYRVLALFFMIGFFLLMNGRMMFALFGMSLLFISIIRWEKFYYGNVRLLFNFLMGLLCCSVSSGAFLVAMIALSTWIFLMKKKRRSLFLKLLFSALLFCLIPISILYLLKNVNYFGGGLSGAVNMLHHGAGIFLYKYGDFFIGIELLIIGIILIMAMMYLFLKLKKYRLLIFMLCISAMGGLFGFSTLATGAPVFCVIFILMLRRALLRIQRAGMPMQYK